MPLGSGLQTGTNFQASAKPTSGMSSIDIAKMMRDSGGRIGRWSPPEAGDHAAVPDGARLFAPTAARKARQLKHDDINEPVANERLSIQFDAN